MADSSRVKQFTDEMEQAATDVARDVKDEVGQMIEQGVQSVAGPKLTSQQLQPFDTSTTLSTQGKQKQLEEQQRLTKARKTIKWFQDISAAQKKVREQDLQKQLQRQQLEEQEKQKKKQSEEVEKKIIISPAKKGPQHPGQAPLREDIALSRPELKSGHGKGG